MTTPGFRAFAATGGNEEREKDETYKRVVGKKHVPDIGKGSLMFRLVSSDEKDVGHFIKFWLNIGLKDDGDYMTLPRISANPFTDFLVSDGKGGTRVGRTAGAAKGCMLSKLAENNHPLIALSDYKDYKGNPKKNIDAIHVFHIQLISRKRDPQGRAMKNPDGSNALVIEAEEKLLEMPQTWFDQFVNIVDPLPVTAAGADDDLREKPKVVKVLPTKDLTRVVWMMTKEKRVKNATGDAKKDVDYVLDFAGTTVVKDSEMVPVKDPVDMTKAFVVIAQDDLTTWMAKAEAGWPRDFAAASGPASAEDDPAKYGQRIPTAAAPAPAAAAPAAVAPAAASVTPGEEAFD